MDQIGKMCRCDCHCIFLGKEPEWECYCKCTTGRKKPVKIVDQELLDRIDSLEKKFITGSDSISASQLGIKVSLSQEFLDRIEKLEKSHRPLIDFVKDFNRLSEKIGRLEFDVKNNSNSIGCVDSAYDDETDKLSERISKLENQYEKMPNRVDLDMLDNALYALIKQERARVDILDGDFIGCKQKIDELEKHIQEIDKYECHNRALIEVLTLDLGDFRKQIRDWILDKQEKISYLDERIEKLEKNIKDDSIYQKSLYDHISMAYAAMCDRIEKLESYKPYGMSIEENFKSISECTSSLDENIFYLNKRIEELESNSDKVPYVFREELDRSNERLEKLEDAAAIDQKDLYKQICDYVDGLICDKQWNAHKNLLAKMEKLESQLKEQTVIQESFLNAWFLPNKFWIENHIEGLSDICAELENKIKKLESQINNYQSNPIAQFTPKDMGNINVSQKDTECVKCKACKDTKKIAIAPSHNTDIPVIFVNCNDCAISSAQENSRHPLAAHLGTFIDDDEPQKKKKTLWIGIMRVKDTTGVHCTTNGYDSKEAIQKAYTNKYHDFYEIEVDE